MYSLLPDADVGALFFSIHFCLYLPLDVTFSSTVELPSTLLFLARQKIQITATKKTVFGLN